MHISFIANARIPSERAMATALMKQCEAFARAGNQVTLVVPTRSNLHTEDPFVYHDTEPLFTIRYLPSIDIRLLEKVGLRFALQKVSFFISLLIYVWCNRIDILYTREPELIALLPTHVPKFVELHHLFGLGHLGRFFLSRCLGVVVLTRALGDDVMSLFGYPESNICIAPSGVELARFQVSVTREDIREKLGIHTNLPIALYIGALETWKGYQVFLEASRQYVGQVQYVVIGGNEAVISSLKEKYPHVLFLGFLPQKDLPHTQQVADVLVVPNSGGEVISERYTSPLKVFAHMASGIPIVASGTTALREVLNETNALLVPPDDAKALGEGIKHVLTKETESLLRAGRALNDVQSYDWSVRTATIVAHIEHAQHRDGVIFDSEIV